MKELLSIIIVFLVLFVFARGIVITLTRNFWLAILMMILLTPLYVVWVFFEGIFGK